MINAAPSDVVMEVQASASTTDTVKASDKIAAISSEIESLSREQAFSMVPDLIGSVDYSYFKLGGVLSVIQNNAWWEDEADTFKAFIENNSIPLSPRETKNEPRVDINKFKFHQDYNKNWTSNFRANNRVHRNLRRNRESVLILSESRNRVIEYRADHPLLRS